MRLHEMPQSSLSLEPHIHKTWENLVEIKHWINDMHGYVKYYEV